MSAGAETATSAVTAAAPGLVGAVVFLAGPPGAAAIIIWAVFIGGLFGSYAGGIYQMLRECEHPTGRDWARLALRVSASTCFAMLVGLALAALAGSADSIPTVAGHPFLVAAVAGFVGLVSPLVIPEIQRRAARQVRDYKREPKQ